MAKGQCVCQVTDGKVQRYKKQKDRLKERGGDRGAHFLLFFSQIYFDCFSTWAEQGFNLFHWLTKGLSQWYDASIHWAAVKHSRALETIPQHPEKTPQQHEHRHPKQPLGCPTPVLLDELSIITIYIDCTDSKPCYFFLERENFKYSFKFLLYFFFFFFKWILQRRITAVAVSCGVSACVLDGYSSKWVSKLCMFIRDICWDQKNTEFRFRWVESIV